MREDPNKTYVIFKGQVNKGSITPSPSIDYDLRIIIRPITGLLTSKFISMAHDCVL